jgi:hypothetical protein
VCLLVLYALLPTNGVGAKYLSMCGCSIGR